MQTRTNIRVTSTQHSPKEQQKTANPKRKRHPIQEKVHKTNVHEYTRRGVLFSSATGLLWVYDAKKTEASKLGATVDRAWEKIGGGPSDLFFPSEFLGTWKVQSTLVNVETPVGEARALSSIQGYKRAKSELEQTIQYRVRFFENRRGQVVMDRVFNTAEMLKNYYGGSLDLREFIRWDPEDPNALRLSLPGGMNVSTLITRRSQKAQASQNRLETSEFMRMVMDPSTDMSSSIVLGSQCFTKYKWRSAEEATRVEGPMIVATQVVSEFPFSSSSADILPSFQPVVVYTYKMQFQQS